MSLERQQRQRGTKPKGWVHPYVVAADAYEALAPSARPAFLARMERSEDRAFVRMILYAVKERAIQRQGKYRRKN